MDGGSSKKTQIFKRLNSSLIILSSQISEGLNYPRLSALKSIKIKSTFLCNIATIDYWPSTYILYYCGQKSVDCRLLVYISTISQIQNTLLAANAAPRLNIQHGSIFIGFIMAALKQHFFQHYPGPLYPRFGSRVG